MSESKTDGGLFFGVAAYGLWGLFPLYWTLLARASAVEVLAHRVAWSLVVTLLLVWGTRRWPGFVAIWRSPAARWRLAVAAAILAVNWGVYIWGVNSGHVVETSLGYFINPLVTVGLGVLVLGERLGAWQWTALGIALAAVVVLTLDYGHPPWIALILAASFATYGLLKKQASVGAIESQAYESLVLAPLSLGYLTLLEATGAAVFAHAGAATDALLALSGVVTAVPLILFGAAALRLSMTALGLLQYLAPIIQFALGLLVFSEAMSPARWLGFAFVWVALLIFTVDALRSRRASVRAALVVESD